MSFVNMRLLVLIEYFYDWEWRSIFTLDNNLQVFAKVRFFNENHTAWKVSKYVVISDPYLPLFGLNTDIYFVNLRIQSE